MTVFFSCNMLDKRIETHIEKKWTETISLQDNAANRNERSVELDVIIDDWTSMYKRFTIEFM